MAHLRAEAASKVNIFIVAFHYLTKDSEQKPHTLQSNIYRVEISKMPLHNMVLYIYQIWISGH